MTRQNVTEGVREVISRTCPTCDGEGVIKSEETTAIEFERRMRELASRAGRGVEAFLIRMHPHVSAEFTGQGARVLHQLESETGKFFHFTGTESLAHDHFDVVKEGLNDEILEQAVPFKSGDEVLVTIVEPHMYDVDDAVAKVDGYVISVVGGGGHVGEKRLVRSEDAGRTAATAYMVDESGELIVPPQRDSGGDDVESKPRRRGRRGGRRRSAAKAKAAEAEADSPAVETTSSE
jgi:ribonuclease G